MILVGHVFVQSPRFRPTVRPASREDLIDEQRWATSFANSQAALAKLAERAQAHFVAGKTEPLDPDRL